MARKKTEAKEELEVMAVMDEVEMITETKETKEVKETVTEEAKIVIPEVTPMNTAMYSEGMMDPYEIAHAKAALAAKTKRK